VPGPRLRAAERTEEESTFALRKVEVKDAGIDWTDERLTPPLSTALHVDVSLADLSNAPAAPPAQLQLSARIDDCVERLDLVGRVSASPGSVGAEPALDATGGRAGPSGPSLLPTAHP